MHAEPTAVSVGAGGVSFSFGFDVSATGVLGTGGPASRFLVSLAAVDGGIGVDGGLGAADALPAGAEPVARNDAEHLGNGRQRRPAIRN